MNERIKEFVAQVEKYISTTNFEGMPEDEMTYDEIFQKKFAKLIVEECAGIAANCQAENMNWDIAEIIKEHFGVDGVE
jgi:hypothetical protein